MERKPRTERAADEKAINFTKKAIDNLPLPGEGKRLEFYDTKVSRLLVRVTSTGRKTFQVYRWHQGKGVRVTLAVWPDLTIEQVRKMAEEANASFAKGENPADKKRQARQEMTFGDLFALYMEKHAKPNKRTWQEDQSQFDRYLAPLASRRLSTITKGDIRAIHQQIGESAPIAANRCLALLSSVFGRMAELEIWEGLNPCIGIKKFSEQSRDRFLSGSEIARFFQALEQEPSSTARDFFLVALMTGARRENVLSMAWDDIDLTEKTWRIGRTKNGTPQTVPLVEPVVEILQARQGNDSPFVFPGRKSESGHLMEPKRAWQRICKAAGIDGARIHDLRRTMGSWQAKTGASLPIIGKSLNHKSASSTSIYARLDMDPVRAAMETAVDAMIEAANGQEVTE